MMPIQKVLTRGTALLCLCLPWFADNSVAATVETSVPTEAGPVSGVATSGVHAWLGIPFAAPPVGELRWRAPQPAPAWQGVRKAEALAPACAQAIRPGPPRPGDPTYAEDCLYLNIWTPASAPNARLPVMVWIYGGGFQWGGTSDPKTLGAQLARKGVVVVSVAYRVGPLGFMAHPELTKEADYRASGNYGILDQIAALRWVRANIAAFGGAPDNITLFGESAGSTSINILQASPLAKNLFQRVIGESTSQMDSTAGLGPRTLAQSEQAGLAYQASLGAHSLAELRALPAAKLTSVDTMFWPIERDGYVLPLSVYETFEQGRQNPATALLGANAREGDALNPKWVKPTAAQDKAQYAQLYGQLPDPERQLDTDTVLWQMWSWGRLNARSPATRSYLYWFSQSPPALPNRTPGPVHGAEIIYVFDNLATQPAAWTEADRTTARVMSTYWTNFAKTGNPNGSGLPVWPVFDERAPRVLELSGAPGVIDLPRTAQLKFVDEFFSRRRAAAAAVN